MVGILGRLGLMNKRKRAPGYLVVKDHNAPGRIIDQTYSERLTDLFASDNIYFSGSDQPVYDLLEGWVASRHGKIETFNVIKNQKRKSIQIKVVVQENGKEKVIKRLLRSSI